MKRYLQILLVLVVVISAFWSGSWYGHGEGETALPKSRRLMHYVDPMNPANRFVKARHCAVRHEDGACLCR